MLSLQLRNSGLFQLKSLAITKYTLVGKSMLSREPHSSIHLCCRVMISQRKRDIILGRPLKRPGLNYQPQTLYENQLQPPV